MRTTRSRSCSFAQKGKRVTVKLVPERQLTACQDGDAEIGTWELTGREFFDAAVDLKQIRALIVRTKN